MQRADHSLVTTLFFPAKNGRTDGLPGVVARREFRVIILGSTSPGEGLKALVTSKRLFILNGADLVSGSDILGKNGRNILFPIILQL